MLPTKGNRMRLLVPVVALLSIGTARDPYSECAGAQTLAAWGGASADLAVTLGTVSDPPTGILSFRVTNNRPDAATAVIISTATAEDTDFQFISIDTVPKGLVRCTTPPLDDVGPIACNLGDLAAGSSVIVDVGLRISAPPSTRIRVTLNVQSETPDPDSSNNSFTSEYDVPDEEEPPSITSARSARINGSYAIILEGEHLELGIGGSVGIGCDCELWQQVVQTSETQITMLGGRDLRAQFPKHVPTRICVRTSAGVAYVTFIR